MCVGLTLVIDGYRLVSPSHHHSLPACTHTYNYTYIFAFQSNLPLRSVASQRRSETWQYQTRIECVPHAGLE